MLSAIILDYPIWFFILCLLLGALYAGVLYFRDRTFNTGSENSRQIIYGLSFIRFVVVSFIAFLLLAPFLKSSHSEEEKPIIAILQDNSASILTGMSAADSAAYVGNLNKLMASLEEVYEVETYSFGDDLEEGISLTFTDKTTDIAGALEGIANKYINQNLGAVVIASDGIYNQGNNPLYNNTVIQAPIYSIALGDTIPKKDLKIGRVYNNRIAYLGDKFSVDIDLAAINFKGASSVLRINKISRGGEAQGLFQKSINITTDDFSLTETVVLDAIATGLQHYRVTLDPLDGEITRENNFQDFFIDVLDGRQKVLILANSPHPDITAIKQSLEENKNYETEIGFINTFNKPIKEYNLIILHQLPSVSNPNLSLLNQIKENQIPLLFILGKQTSVAAFNQVQNVLKINNNRGNFNEVEAVVNSDFTMFKIPEDINAAVSKYPPLIVPYGEFATAPGAMSLLKQKIGTISTAFPLLLFDQSMGTRVGVLTGEGMWRWRLYNYQLLRNHKVFDELVSKSIQYLAVKADKRQFRVILPQNIFNENEQVVMDAELYNESFELVNTPEVAITITNEDKKDFTFNFNKSGNAYTLNAGFFPVGSYSFLASTNFNGKKYTYEGQFSISPVKLEAIHTTADHQLLYMLSEAKGGRLYFPSQMELLSENILESNSIKPVLHETQETKAFINLRWVFFILLILMSAEWFIRKYNGAY